MHHQKIKSTWEQADQFLQSAENEMYRAAEDVVPHMVCSNARQSIVNYLNGFLLKNGIENKTTMSIEELLNQCRDIDPRFKNLKLDDNMYCSNEEHNDFFCTNLKKVEECLELATQAKKMVSEESESWPLSKPIK